MVLKGLLGLALGILHTFCPLESSVGPRSEPIVTSAPDITPVSYPRSCVSKAYGVIERSTIHLPKSKPDIVQQHTRSHTNHVVCSSPSATTANSDISPAAVLFRTISSSSSMWPRRWTGDSFEMCFSSNDVILSSWSETRKCKKQFLSVQCIL